MSQGTMIIIQSISSICAPCALSINIRVEIEEITPVSRTDTFSQFNILAF